MKYATMLYRSPGPHTFEGVSCETTIVDEPDVQAMLADGWHRNWIEAAQATTAAQLQVNEEEQQRIAAQLAGAGQGDGADLVGEPGPQLKAVHKGRGVWEVQDTGGDVVKSGLTKEQAQAALGG